MTATRAGDAARLEEKQPAAPIPQARSVLTLMLHSVLHSIIAVNSKRSGNVTKRPGGVTDGKKPARGQVLAGG